MTEDWRGKRKYENRAADIEDAKETIKAEFGGNTRAYAKSCEDANRATRRLIDQLQGRSRVPAPGDFENMLEADQWLEEERRAAIDKAKQAAMQQGSSFWAQLSSSVTFDVDDIVRAMLTTAPVVSSSQVSMSIMHEPEADVPLSVERASRAAIMGSFNVQWESQGIFKIDVN